MCKIGDLILIRNPKTQNKIIGQHTFIVMDDSGGIIRGMFEYDFIALVMTSYNESDETRHEKLKAYANNFHVSKLDKILDDEKYHSDNRAAYVRADMIFYFSKEKIKYKKIGMLSEEIYNLLVEFVEELQARGFEFKQVIEQTKKL